jgi:hypothetical protein
MYQPFTQEWPKQRIIQHSVTREARAISFGECITCATYIITNPPSLLASILVMFPCFTYP